MPVTNFPDGVNTPTLQINGTDKSAALAATVAAPVAGVAAGYKVARGTLALDGSNPTPILAATHGLTTVIAAVVSLNATAAPGLSTSVVSANISGTTINVYAWKPTGAGDTTLVASTGTENVDWIAVGT